VASIPCCTSCARPGVTDPSGLCDDCQEGIPSSRPGSITTEQRLAIVGLCIDQNLLTPRKRAAELEMVVAGWRYGGDLGWLSQREAGDVLEHLEERRRTQS
jgi:hypothetical protein